MAYSSEEQETVCVYDKIDDRWDVYSCVQKHMTKLNKIQAPYWEDKKDGRVVAAKWKLSDKQLRFANERTYTEDQRAEMAERARERFKT